MNTFTDLALIAPLARALQAAEYNTPTAIQAQTIPPALTGRDILGCAQTGTGKTAAFALPILNSLGESSQKAKPHQPFALVLAPTRELAGQIEKSFHKYGKNLSLRVSTVYGGVGQHRQVRALATGVHVLIATPGRLLDLIGQGHIDLSRLDFFVLDEADRMLDMGFLPAIKRIMALLPDERQSMFFSATLGNNILELSSGLLVDPVTVNVTPKRTSVAQIDQQVVHTQPQQKPLLLRQILTDAEVDRAVVFTRTKRGANVVARALRDHRIAATAIHGDKTQNVRERTLADFRKGKIQVLVATDVASRGIDVAGVTHVVNYDLPHEPESYVHRIGRTGRAGQTGVAIAFCTPAEWKELSAIERLIGQKIPAENEPAERAERPARKRNPSSRRSRPTGDRQREPRSNASHGAVTKPRRQKKRRPRRSTAVATAGSK